MSCLSNNATNCADDKVADDLEHIFLYLSNYKPLSEENSDGIIVRHDDNDQDEDDPNEYMEIELSQIFEVRRTESFVMIYNNSHYLTEPLIFETILAYFYKPSYEENVHDFVHFLNLRRVCKSWKKHIDETHGRQFILSVFKARVDFQECNHLVDLVLFRIPARLPFILSLSPLFIASRFFAGNGLVEGVSLGASFYLTYLVVCGYPMLIPMKIGGYLIDKAISVILNRSLSLHFESQYMKMEHGIMNEVSFFEKCEIISTVQDTEQYNNHSCYYIIEVTINVDGKTLGYQIKKKYTQFKSLYDSMCNCIKKDVLEVNEERIEFPVKRWSIFSDSQQVIEERKKVFNRLLELIVSRADLFHSVDIYSFFYDRDKQHLLLGNTSIESGEDDGFLLIDKDQ